MRFDHAKFDGVVLVGARRAKGLWANQLQLLRSPVVRNGGRLNSSEATNHSLLSMALVSALRNISSKMAADLISRRHDGRKKPVLLIKSTDTTFLPALEALIRRQQGPQLRAIRSLHRPLAHQVSRFLLVCETEHNPAALALIEWTEHNTLRPSDISDVAPVVLLPTAVNVRERLQRA